MKNQLRSIEAIQSTLNQLQQNPSTRNSFPRELWDSIIQLTKSHSLEEVSCPLSIMPTNLKRKIQPSQGALEFRELTIAGPITSELITIEISSNDGLKAKIQGSLSCLDYLHKFFGR